MLIAFVTPVIVVGKQLNYFCQYIAQQPAHKRIIIYHENFNNAFILNYGRKDALKRITAGLEELKTKMTKMANYLLIKHRK